MTDTTATDDDLSLDPWVGMVLGGRYRLVAAIGAGGMGVVYRAWDLATDRYVVVKMPKRELLGEPKFLQRFEQELFALRSLSHPAVVPIQDVGGEQGTPYAVMPYLAGGSLKQRRLFREDGQAAPEPPANLWRWLPAVAQALDFVHASGYVHRDVKPDNILYDGPGNPFLSDFGVAKIVLQTEDETASRGLTGTGMALGTPAYMAPELISGTKPSPQVDQYALAVTVYELLAARKPFDGPTPAAVILAHVTGNAPALASLLPGLPAALSDAVARGMAREPADRFGSCVEFATAALATMPRPSAAEKLQLMCPQCSRLLNVRPDWAGKAGNCPRCKSAMAIGGDLKSLWLQGDRLGTPPAGETVPVRILAPTPSLPISVPQLPRQIETAQPESMIDVLKEQFLGSKILKAAAAGVATLCALLVALTFMGGGKAPPRPAKPKAIAKADVAVGETNLPQQISTAEATAASTHEVAKAEPPTGTTTTVIVPGQSTHAKKQRQEATVAQSIQPPPTPSPPVDPVNPLLANELASKPNDLERTSAPQPGSDFRAAERPDAMPKKRQREPVPAADELKKAIATIQDAYEDRYDEANEQGEWGPLASDLVDVAEGTQDASSRYALLWEAQRLLEEDLDLERALKIVEQRTELYDEDRPASQKKLLDRLKGKRSTNTPLFEQAVDVAQRSLDESHFDVADAAVDLADSVVKASKSAAHKPKRGRRGPDATPNGDNALQPQAIKALEDSLKELKSTVSDRKKTHRVYTEALADLDKSPDDAKAHGVVGTYLCFEKATWPDGLRHLAASDLERLANLAQRQMDIDAAGRKDIARVFEIAGEWWEYADNAPPSAVADRHRVSIRRFAGHMYDEIAPALEDKVEIRLAEKRRFVEGDEPHTERKPFADLAGDLPENLKNSPQKDLGRPGKKPRTEYELAARLDLQLKQRMLEKYGGTEESEAAIDQGLQWLLNHQLPDGGWSFDMAACPGCGGKCANSGEDARKKDRAGATGLALLAFYGRGYSHYNGPAKGSLQKGVNFLAALAKVGGGKCYQDQAGMYSQGVATLALAEAYALTKDRRLRDPTQLALNFIMNAQDPVGGGWRYEPRQPGDTSSSGWQFMALKAGTNARLDIQTVTLDRFSFFLNSVQEDNGVAYGYANRGSGGATTAVGILCRTFLGWQINDPRVVAAANNLMRWKNSNDIYYLYYCTLLFRRLGGSHWIGWNPEMRDTLIRHQVQEGHAAGSWHEGVAGGFGGGNAGRLYCTAMATMILESYYRYISEADLLP